MIDPRFFTTNEPLSVEEAAEVSDAEILDPASVDKSTRLAMAADISFESLGHAAIFISEAKFLPDELSDPPAICLVSQKLVEKAAASSALKGTVFLVSANPKASFALLSDYLHKSIVETIGYGNQADAQIHPEAVVDPRAAIGAGAVIERGAVIGPNVSIGPGVIIGEETFIGAGATVTHSLVGERCRLLGGARVGESGFGFVNHDRLGLIRVPQLGRVILKNEVEIGSNTTIDRGMLLDTVIGNQTKIDNQVQIAHNNVIGDRCAFASQTGLSGSTTIGNDVMMGGQCGVTDHVNICDGVIILARGAVMRDITTPGRWAGAPAKPARQWLKETALVAKLAQEKKSK